MSHLSRILKLFDKFLLDAGPTAIDTKLFSPRDFSRMNKLEIFAKTL